MSLRGPPNYTLNLPEVLLPHPEPKFEISWIQMAPANLQHSVLLGLNLYYFLHIWIPQSPDTEAVPQQHCLDGQVLRHVPNSMLMDDLTQQPLCVICRLAKKKSTKRHFTEQKAKGFFPSILVPKEGGQPP